MSTGYLKKSFFLVILIGLILCRANSQTGVFYYTGLDKTFVHNNIVGIKEASNTELYLIGKASTLDYAKSVPYFGRLDKSGLPLMSKFYSDFPVWDTKRMVITPMLSVKIFGTALHKGKYYPVFLQVQPTAKIENKSASTVVYSTVLSDVADKDNYMISAHTKIGENKHYNIVINKVNSANDVYLWTTPINTNIDEEVSKIAICSDNSIVVLGKEYKKNMTTYTPIIYKLSAAGKVLWRVNITVPPNFFTQDIVQVDRSSYVYMCSYGKEYLGTSETRLVQLSSNGSPTKSTTVSNINGNGILIMENKHILVYGSNLTMLSGRVVTRAKYAIVSRTLELQYQRELGSADRPDSLMPQTVATNFPTTSDFSCATLLKDGRIAIAGKVYMPINPKQPSPKGGDRYNAPLLVILDKMGKGI